MGSPALFDGPDTFVGALSGGIDLVAPDWRDIALSDVAIGLSRLARWNGQTRRPISVLEHTLVVASLAPAHALAVLLHDAHEYAIGDITRPMRRALEYFIGAGAIHALERMARDIDVAIARAVLEASVPSDARPGRGLAGQAIALAAEMRLPAVIAADNRALAIEDAEMRRASASEVRFYPEDAPDPDAMIADWLRQVARAATARFASA
jgi:hypothetical protein